MPAKPRKYEEKNEAVYLKQAIHHGNLTWIVTSIFMVAIIGLYTFALKAGVSLLFLFSGLAFTAVMVYMMASFRVLRRDAMKKAKERGETEFFKTHLNQWFSSLLLYGIVGILWICEISNSFQSFFITSILIIIWMSYIIFMYFRYKNI